MKLMKTVFILGAACFELATVLKPGVALAQGSDQYSNQTCSNFYPADKPYYTEDFRTTQPAASKTFKMVSYNIDLADPQHMEQIGTEMQTIAALKDADFILLQEAVSDIGSGDSGARALAKKLGMAYVWTPNMVLWGKDYGNAVLSRYPIKSFEKILLPQSTKENCNLRSALQIIATTPVGDIQVVSVHLSTVFSDTILGFDKQRSAQLKVALDAVAAANLPTYIAGDMNTVNPFGTNSLIATAESMNYQNAQTQSGWTNRTHNFHLDQAFANSAWTVVDSGIAQEAEASDHVPIWSQIRLN